MRVYQFRHIRVGIPVYALLLAVALAGCGGKQEASPAAHGANLYRADDRAQVTAALAVLAADAARGGDLNDAAAEFSRAVATAGIDGVSSAWLRVRVGRAERITAGRCPSCRRRIEQTAASYLQ